MITILRDDELLGELPGTTIRSDVSPEIAYRLVGQAGADAMFASFYAVRSSPEGDCPVVLKLLRPSFCRQLGDAAAVVVKKESVSLGRLNERVPPTPFVVRLIDAGTLAVQAGSRQMTLPWITIEYVHGGAQGTTLLERVQRAMESTGHAFDPARATRAIDCMARGLAAVHEVGVIHRDVSPTNILCCGAGEQEIFKLSGFGLARPAGVKDTIKAGVVGASGVGPPELLSSKPGSIGPWTDVFSLAAVVYLVLTGEPYFIAPTMMEALQAVGSRTRRSVLEGRYLHPALRADEPACKAIDFALRWATSAAMEDRLQETEALAAMLTPYLRPAALEVPLLTRPAIPPAAPAAGRAVRVAWQAEAGPVTLPTRPRQSSSPDVAPAIPAAPAAVIPAAQAVRESVLPEVEIFDPEIGLEPGDRATLPSAPSIALQPVGIEAELEPSRPERELAIVPAGPPRSGGDRWAWTALHHPDAHRVLRSLAWDGYGRCLAASSDGLQFWNGMTWCVVASDRLPHPTGMRFVHRAGAGRWLVGGDGSTLAVYTTGGVTGVLQRPGVPEVYTALSGDLEDMGVLAAAPPNGPPILHAFVGRRWLRSFAVGGAAHLASLARVEDERWLVACHMATGRGMLALYAPLDWHMERIHLADVRAFNACDGRPEAGMGIAVGADGTVVWSTPGGVDVETIEHGRDLSAVALGADDTAWAAGAGRIWRRGHTGTWTCVWADDGWVAPIVSLYVDFGVVVAVSVDGGILEGRPCR